MKKILFLGGLNPGGAEHQMVILAKLLANKNYDVSYLYTDNSDFFKKDLVDTRVSLIKIKKNKIVATLKLDIPWLTLNVYRELKRGKYDVVVSFLSLWNFENCLFSKIKSTRHKAITGLRNNRDTAWLSRKNKFYVYHERKATYKVCNSDAARIRFASCFPKMSTKLLTIYNIVELPIISTQYIPCNNDKVHIIIPASYREVKNPMGLLEAMRLLSIEDQKKIQIDWYGKIDMGRSTYDEMKAFINQNNLGSVIYLHDAIKNIENKINEADFVGLFSKSEGLPNAVCEGMMLAKPIIMTKVSDYAILVDDSNGFICEKNDVIAIRDSLKKVASVTKKQIAEMGRNSQKKAIRLFSKESVLAQWIEIL